MKTFLRILLFIATLLLFLLGAGVIALKLGIQIDNFRLSNIEVEQLDLQWNDRLQAEVGSITIHPSHKASDGKFDIKQVRNALHILELLENGFSTIHVEKIQAGPLVASLDYHHADGGKITARSPLFSLDAILTRTGDTLVADISRLVADEYKSHLAGEVTIDVYKATLTATLDIMLAETLPLTMTVNADTDRVEFSGKGKQPAASIAPIVGLFNLGPTIAPWIDEYLVGSAFTLKTVSGTVPYDNPTAILHTLHAIAVVDDTQYTFEQGLAPIKAKVTTVEFIDAVLKINPEDATFYGQDAGDSHLDIDFNDNKAILTAYIKTSAQASGGVLKLLEHYAIPFPFEQVSGLTDTDLTLAINLESVDITAEGHFKSANSTFKYDNQLIEAETLDVSLKNTDIRIERLDLSRDRQYRVRINGDLDAARGKGDLLARVDQFAFVSDHATLRLANRDNQPLAIRYRMRNEGDQVDIAASTWDTGNMLVDIGAFQTPFDHKDWTGTLPPTQVNVSPMLKSIVSGTFSRVAPYAQLDIKLVELTHDVLRLDAPDVELQVEVGDDISIASLSNARLSIGETPVTLFPSKATYGNQKLDIRHSRIELADRHSSIVTGQMDFNLRSGRLLLEQLAVNDKFGDPVLAIDAPLEVKISTPGDVTLINITDLATRISIDGQGAWSANISNLSPLYKHSPLLQRYQLQSGSIIIRDPGHEQALTFDASLTLPHALLIDGDEPILDYTVSGRYANETLNADINDSVRITASDSVTLTANDIGISIPAITKLAENLNDQDGKQEKSRQAAALSLTLNATNSFLWLGSERRALADKLSASLEKGVINAELVYGAGTLHLEYKDDNVSLVGANLGKSFLNDLITLADFDRGTMEIHVSGNVDDLTGAVNINDTIIKNYKTLNNILAFINTVPALLTFRVPDYSSKGLPAREISLGFHYGKGVLDIKSLTIDSSALDLRGEGSADFNNDTISMKFNLITGAGKNTRRIPLLGYVLSGDKSSPSITVTVNGDLQDPTVKNTAFKEVTTYPFQVLKNTVTLPSHLVKKVSKTPESKVADEETTTTKEN